MALALATLFVLYALFVLHAFSTTGPEVSPQRINDTVAYKRMSSLSVLDRDFLAGERAFVYALLLKMTRRNLALAGYIQTFFSLGCWGFLAWSTLRIYATARGKILGFCMVLLCASREEILFANGISMSESLSYSLFALWIGSWVMFARGAHRLWKYFPLVTSFLFTFVRDSNAFLVFGAAILLAIACAGRFVPRRYLLLSLALVIFFAAGLVSRAYSFRARYSLQNNISGRILIDEWRTAELVKLGMPAGLSAYDKSYLAGKCGNQAWEFRAVLGGFGHTAVDDLVAWERISGQRQYLVFLLRHPGYVVWQPFREDGVLKFLFPLARWIKPRVCDFPLHEAVKFRTLFPRPLRDLLRGETPAWFLLFWFITASACVLGCLKHRPSRGPFVWILVLLLSSIPHLLVVWHGDAQDLSRHALLVGIQVHLAGALAFALACDAFSVLQREPGVSWTRRSRTPVIGEVLRSINAGTPPLPDGSGRKVLLRLTEKRQIKIQITDDSEDEPPSS